jgi:hypothetical protein
LVLGASSYDRTQNQNFLKVTSMKKSRWGGWQKDSKNDAKVRVQNNVKQH